VCLPAGFQSLHFLDSILSEVDKWSVLAKPIEKLDDGIEICFDICFLLVSFEGDISCWNLPYSAVLVYPPNDKLGILRRCNVPIAGREVFLCPIVESIGFVLGTRGARQVRWGEPSMPTGQVGYVLPVPLLLVRPRLKKKAEGRRKRYSHYGGQLDWKREWAV
jgi:hypothetical protein